jgi:uncharacterized membrane protein
VVGGDALVVGAGYLTLRLFAAGTLSPTAGNFRNAAFALAGTALVVPPLTAVLLARLAGGSEASGSFWRALSLALAGNLMAFLAGYLAAPNLWVILPVQLVAISAGTSLGAHWTPAPERTAADTAAARGRPASALAAAVCPDG